MKVDNYLILGCVHYYVLDLSFRESSSLFFVGDQLSPKILPATSGFSRHVSLSTKDDEQLKWFQIVQSLPFMSAKRSVFDTGHARWRAALKLQAASTMWILFLVLFKPFHILLKISRFLIASEASYVYLTSSEWKKISNSHEIVTPTFFQKVRQIEGRSRRSVLFSA